MALKVLIFNFEAAEIIHLKVICVKVFFRFRLKNAFINIFRNVPENFRATKRLNFRTATIRIKLLKNLTGERNSERLMAAEKTAKF